MNRNPALLTLIAVLFAAGCSSPEPVPQTPPKPVEAPVEIRPSDPVEDLLVRAARDGGDQSIQLRLEAAALLLDRDEPARAVDALAPLSNLRLLPAQRANRSLLLARADLARGEPERALARLSSPDLKADVGTDRGLAVAAGRALAQSRLAIGEPLAAAEALADIQPWLATDAERDANARALLNMLGQARLGDVQSAIDTASSDDWRAWLELSSSLREIGVAPSTQRLRLAQWRSRYAGVPALEIATRAILPALEETIAAPARTAVLLPLSGRASSSGQAVLQGYLAERFSQSGTPDQQLPVAIIDTAAEPGGFAGAYRRAVADGATVVVGPLLKEDLKAFGPSLPVTAPTLALNFLEGQSREGAQLSLFGLDTADEIAQLAGSARAAGYSRILALVGNDDRSRRLAEDFQRVWAADRGQSIGTLFLGDLNEYRASLEQILLLEQSAERARQLEQLLGMTLVTEPRHRADVDAVMIFAEPPAARSIRSLLAFVYAGDLPAWGTSMSRSAGDPPEANLDLEGVRFLDMPWFGPAESVVRTTTSVAVPPGQAERLVALGADAARLQSRLGLLDALPEAGLSGATGELRRDADGRLRRRSDWYVFKSGTPTAEQPRKGFRDVSGDVTGSAEYGEGAWTQPTTPAEPLNNAH